MKNYTNIINRLFDGGRVAGGGRRLAQIGGALAIASSILVAGSADTSNSEAPPSSMSSSTEGIGSLPSVYAPDPETPYDDPYGGDSYGGLVPVGLQSPGGLVRPFVVLDGVPADVDSAVTTADGDGLVSVLPRPDGSGRWIYGFHGEVELGLDPVFVPARGLDVGVHIGAEFAGGLGVIAVGGNFTPVFALSDATISTPLAELIQLALLSDGGIEIFLLSPSRTRARITMELYGGQLAITQVIR